MTVPQPKSALNVVMGALAFGEPGTDGARVHDIKDVEAMLDVFRSHGHAEIDTARSYGGGTSEQYLGKIDLRSKGLKIETKLLPTVALAFPDADPISHTPEGLRTHLHKSLEALNVKSLEIWYLHAPDRSVPYEVTMKAVNDLYQEGYFKRFGISNYAAWEVAEIVHICRANGYIQPTAYQGIYNAVHRSVEQELFPCLKKYGISFYEFNPSGGFLSGKYASIEDSPGSGTRFDRNLFFGKMYSKRYWNEPYFNAINGIRTAADKHSLTLVEVALRWLSHHSFMKREHGDSILIGASCLNHVKQNLVDLEKGPLPEDVLQALDAAWLEVQPYASKYFY